MTRALLAAALLAGIGLSAGAQAQDPRLVDRLYNPDEVVRIEGKVNVQATIRFGEDERIENVAIGDSQKWQVTPNRSANLLFVKPLAERASTNMTVVTNEHVYLFDLIASPAHRDPLYVLSFTYPIEVEEVEEVQLAEDDAAPAQTASPVEMAAANDPYAVLDPSQLNFAWAAEGKSELLPERIYDDGDATFLAWPAGQPMPAILVRDEEGTEGPVNFAVRGDTIVLDMVPAEIILRSGNDAATLVNNGSATPAGNGQANADRSSLAGA